MKFAKLTLNLGFQGWKLSWAWSPFELWLWSRSKFEVTTSPGGAGKYLVTDIYEPVPGNEWEKLLTYEFACWTSGWTGVWTIFNIRQFFNHYKGRFLPFWTLWLFFGFWDYCVTALTMYTSLFCKVIFRWKL